MFEAFPLQWPASKIRTPVGSRKRARFSDVKSEYKKYSNMDGGYTQRTVKAVSVASSIIRLLKEFQTYKGRVNMKEVVISTNLPVSRNGFPYSDKREPEDCGVAVYFTLDKVDYCFPCDKWDRVADNIAAIASHLNAMRGMERWGVGEYHDVFTGFKAIPETINVRNIWEVLGIRRTTDLEEIRIAYRNKAKILHPDAGGNKNAFQELQDAYNSALNVANNN